MKIENNEINSISFTGFGVYGLGYDSWFQSKIYFNIDLNNEHRKYPQKGKCLNENSRKK